jgi:site-specific DNA recombinase
MNDLKGEFDRHQRNGYLGDPEGAEAYAYLRASSERQVEEGSSFPRQIESVHKAALRDKLRVPIELIFFDDGFSGFEFEHRPALLKLRHEVSHKARAAHLVIEDIDRLSRNADWQQGFLLEEFTRHKVTTHFYISPGSQLERYVRGYIAQEGMKKDIERMKQGNLFKALDGRVTARRARYGYIKTHPQNSYYELHPEQSKVMRWVYEELIYKGATLHTIASWLNDHNVPTRFKSKFWTASTLYQMVTSPVYKGEFYANVTYHVKTGKYNEKGKPKRICRKRPKSEWIKVECPSIVTPEEWDMAREALNRNAKVAKRNTRKRDWLLQGLVKCEFCKTFTLVGLYNDYRKWKPYYFCASRRSEKARKLGTACYTPYLEAELLERRVWEELEKVIYDPAIIIRRLEEKRDEERTMGYQAQIDFMTQELAGLAKERAKLEAAYRRDIYNLDEFEEKMKDLKGKVEKLELSKAKVSAKLSETQSIEEQKQMVLSSLSQLRAEVEKAKHENRLPGEIPFALKRRLTTILVDVIWVNTKDRKFTIEGEVKGTFDLDDPVSGSNGDGFGFASSPRSRRCARCP